MRLRFALLLLAVSCAGSDARTPPAVAGSVEVDPTPVLTIGREGDPAYEFTDIVAFGRLSNGRWYIVDRGSADVRFYDEQGVFVRRAGGRGEGPGEFQYLLGAAALPNGDLLLHDAMLWRLTRLDASGDVIDVMPLPPPPAGFAAFFPIGLFGDRPVWSSVKTPPCIEKTVVTDTMGYFQLVDDEIIEIARVSGGQRWGNSTNILRRCLPNGVPFAGPPIAVAHDGLLYIARRDVREVHVIDPATGSRRVLEGAAEREPLTDERIAAWIEAEIGQTFRDERGQPLPNGLGRAEYEQRLRETPYPDSLPAASQLEVDPAGRVWIASYAGPEAAAVSWVVISADGGRREALTLPARYRITEIGPDYLAAVTRDSFDVQRAVVHRLGAGR